jgi:hypothetical protein
MPRTDEKVLKLSRDIVEAFATAARRQKSAEASHRRAAGGGQ